MSAPVGAPVIDLNADLGEGAGHDEALLDIVTSANVACGGHAGDATTIRATCAAAAERGVIVGAHPGYPDRPNFGRLPLDLPPGALARSLAEQLTALGRGAAAAGTSVRYLKAHGALYHRVATDPETAALLVRAAGTVAIDADAGGSLTLLGPPGQGAAHVAKRSLGQSAPDQGAPDHATDVRHVVEGFADRAYTTTSSGRPTLADRRRPGALLEHDAAVAQAVALVTTGLATAHDGTPVAVHPRSLCVHGDSPGAVALAREIRAELERAGVRIEAFVG